MMAIPQCNECQWYHAQPRIAGRRREYCVHPQSLTPIMDIINGSEHEAQTCNEMRSNGSLGFFKGKCTKAGILFQQKASLNIRATMSCHVCGTSEKWCVDGLCFQCGSDRFVKCVSKRPEGDESE